MAMISSELILSWVEKEVRVITFDFFLPKQNDNFVATDHYMYFYPFPNFKAGSWNTFMPNVRKEQVHIRKISDLYTIWVMNI